MASTFLEILGLQIESPQLAQIVRPQPGKFIQQLPQRLALALPRLAQSIEWIESSGLAEFQQQPRPRHPVSTFAVNQMTDHIERAPCVSAFVAKCPYLLQVAQKRVED